MSPSAELAVNSFLEVAAFVVNSMVFLLIGLEIQVTTLADLLRQGILTEQVHHELRDELDWDQLNPAPEES
jgi:hypothetical protein